jgi:MoaA/NifB/PqqE/SkfB family radical SAM enzyme
MNKLRIQNLALIVTEKCNLNCAHCLRGGCSDKVMGDNVIKATLDQFEFIGNLTICGGEPTLALDRVERILNYIAQNKIFVGNVSFTINGTIYSDDFLRLLDYIEPYLEFDKSLLSPVYFGISLDKFHYDEVCRLNMKEKWIENINKYTESRHFYDFRKIERKLFREGNAVNLEPNLTVPLRPMPIFMSYYKKGLFNIPKFDKNGGKCFIGPLITINVDGIVTECDASLEHQRTIYNYGNIFDNSIEEICLNNNPVFEKPGKFERVLNKTLNRYHTYNK